MQKHGWMDALNLRHLGDGGPGAAYRHAVLHVVDAVGDGGDEDEEDEDDDENDDVALHVDLKERCVFFGLGFWVLAELVWIRTRAQVGVEEEMVGMESFTGEELANCIQFFWN